MTLKDRSILDGDDVDSVLPHLTCTRPLRPALWHPVYERLRCATRPVGGPLLVSVLHSKARRERTSSRMPHWSRSRSSSETRHGTGTGTGTGTGNGTACT